jgi:N-acetylglucosaminyl-diphospho-decaprenol L-rhamnosyltransferase
MPPIRPIPIIIVSARNPRDVAECVQALDTMVKDPAFDIYICVNGGGNAFDDLTSCLVSKDGPCDLDDISPLDHQSPEFLRSRCLRLRNRVTRIMIAEAAGNLGYAEAVNAWLRILMRLPRWPGVWILNSDSLPDRHALAELVACSKTRRKGMVGSRIIDSKQPEKVQTRGLRWQWLRASTVRIDNDVAAAVEPKAEELEARIDAPFGASIYVTRDCLQRIGLMDERYFLYFEDLDWGYRAKSCCGIGYAHNSIVTHKGAAAIGALIGRKTASQLAVYLQFRNRIIFVRQQRRSWLAWTLFCTFLRCFEYGFAGSFTNMRAALMGLKAGAAGEIGRPDGVFDFRQVVPSLRTGPRLTSILRTHSPCNVGNAFCTKELAKHCLKLSVSFFYSVSTLALGLLRRS